MAHYGDWLPSGSGMKNTKTGEYLSYQQWEERTGKKSPPLDLAPPPDPYVVPLKPKPYKPAPAPPVPLVPLLPTQFPMRPAPTPKEPDEKIRFGPKGKGKKVLTAAEKAASNPLVAIDKREQQIISATIDKAAKVAVAKLSNAGDRAARGEVAEIKGAMAQAAAKPTAGKPGVIGLMRGLGHKV